MNFRLGQFVSGILLLLEINAHGSGPFFYRVSMRR